MEVIKLVLEKYKEINEFLSNEDVVEKLKTFNDMESVRMFLSENGFDMTISEIERMIEECLGDELDENSLENVSGGNPVVAVAAGIFVIAAMCGAAKGFKSKTRCK